MPQTLFPFSGGKNATQAYGDRWMAGFSGTWAKEDKWSLELVAPASAQGNIMLGLGQLQGQNATVALNFNNRIYLGLASLLAFSDPTLGPTHWEQQDPGAGFLTFLSNFGNQDAVYGLAIFQGRLAIFGRYSIQLWQTNADPTQFNLLQVLANIGTISPLSVQQLGDYDVLFLDPGTGIRSLRAREITLNAFVDDLGIPIDELVQAALATQGNNPIGVCGIVDPVSKRYWLFLKDTIYVLSLYRSAKITAWSTYKPTYIGGAPIAPLENAYSVGGGAIQYAGILVGQTYYWQKGANNALYLDLSTIGGPNFFNTTGYFVAPGSGFINEYGQPGTLVDSILTIPSTTPQSFTPEKFIVFDNQIFVRSTDGKIFQYGGPSGQQFDGSTLTVLTPWFDMKDPVAQKTAIGLSAAFSGNWTFFVGMDPLTGTLEQVLQDGSSTAPQELKDSTFDKGIMPINARGTHVQIKAQTSQITPRAELAAMSFSFRKDRRDA